MNTMLLALRNLLRNRRRSVTTLLAMIIGSSSILLFGGYSRNITYGLQTSYVQRSGHLQIQHKDYFLFGSGNPAAYGIADYARIVDTVKNDPILGPMVTVVTPTLQVGGIAGNFAAGVSRTVSGTGLVVEDQNQMRRWNDYDLPMRVRTQSLTGTDSDAAVIGNGVARVLQLCAQLNVLNCPQPPLRAHEGQDAAPADIAALSSLEKTDVQEPTRARIEILAANVHGAPNVASLNVVKAEAQGVKEVDDVAVLMHLTQAQKLIYGNAAPQVTAVVLQLKHTNQIPVATARLEQLLATSFRDESLVVQEFTTLNPFYGQSIGMFDAIFSFISVLIAAIVLFTVSNTMSMAVMERTVEIGTLRAVGLRRSGIRRLFVFEGLLLGAIGATLGIAVSLGLALIVNHSGLTWLPPGRVEPVPLTVRLWGESGLIVSSAAGLILVAVLSAWWPANRAARLHVVDALRHV
ncbi:ABC transporter permease [Noviherbaspirillum sp. ST9]|uniref:ABC transporter permease n=1 Tax=Noviherbaspirillum sp. ST9 TaxID=3401606 RepID=UPI003B5897AA